MRIFTQLGELLRFRVEIYNFSGAHEGKVKRVEEETDPLSIEGIQRNILELVVPPGHSLESRGGLSDQSQGSSVAAEVFLYGRRISYE